MKKIFYILNPNGEFYSTDKVGKTVLPTHVAIKTKGLPVNSLVLLEHICTMDNSRLQSYVGIASDKTMERVDMAVGISLSLNIN